MNRLAINIEWFDKLLPQGLTIPSSTLISGPGGTGKPLVEFALVAAWLKAGGSLIGIPLQYPDGELVDRAMRKLYHIDMKTYHDKVVYIQFDPGIKGFEKIKDNTIKANMILPEVWDRVIQEAEKLLDPTYPGIMVFGSALKLLLFNVRYQDMMLEKMQSLLQHDKSRSYAFAVSTSAFAEKIKILEDAADNLMFTRMEHPMKLFLKIERVKDLEFSKDEIEVPIPEKILNEINEIAESTRRTRIPEIRKI